MRPVIGVMPLVDEDKDSLWMLPGYLNGVLEAGGIPVIFPLINDVDIIRQMVSSVQGVLLTGGHDVNPALYGEEPIPECGKSNPERDFMERIILDLALQNDIPVLGICRGIQFLNVFLGGTLYQDLPTQHPSKIEHHQMPPYSKPIHRVKIKSDCGLSELLDVKSFKVNSYHHQAIKDLADDLKVMAVSEDKIIEAVEMPGKKFVWAVQWHPEFSYRRDERNKKIFDEFVRHCSGMIE